MKLMMGDILRKKVFSTRCPDVKQEPSIRAKKLTFANLLSTNTDLRRANQKYGSLQYHCLEYTQPGESHRNAKQQADAGSAKDITEVKNTIRVISD